MTDTLIPHILALDTAQEDCGAAILLADGSLFMHVEHVGSRHSERLLPMVRDLIHEAGIEKTDLGLIAFGEGPGSFTGLRVACGAAQGLAWALEVPSPTWKRWLNGFERLIWRLLVREPALRF